MKKLKTITLVSVLIISLLFTSTNIFAENELDNIEVLTFSVDSMYNKGNLDTNKEKHKKLGEIELNRVLSKEDYIKDVNNFKSFYIHEQGYLGGYTKEQLDSDIDKLLQNPTGNTVGDLNLQLAKIISNMNDGHTTAMYFFGDRAIPVQNKNNWQRILHHKHNRKIQGLIVFQNCKHRRCKIVRNIENSEQIHFCRE